MLVEQALGSHTQSLNSILALQKSKTHSEDVLLSLPVVVLSLDSAVVLTIVIKSYLGEKRIYLAYTSTSQSIIEGSQEKIPSRNSRQKPWRNAVC